MQKNSRKCL